MEVKRDSTMARAGFCKECGSQLEYQVIEGRERGQCVTCKQVQYEQLIVGAGAVIERDGQLLLAKRTTQPFKDCWNLPAGHVEADEDPKQAVVREVSEETGLTVEVLGLFDSTFFNDHPKGCGVFLVYSCSVVGGSLEKAERGSNPTFFAPEQLPEDLSGGGHREAIIAWRDRVKSIRREEMWNQLSNAISLRSSQDQVLWSIFGAFWATNAILLVALFNTGQPPGKLVGIVVSVVGFVISVTWHELWMRALGHVRRHETLMERIERKLGFEPQFAVSSDINIEDYKENVGKGIRARQIMPFLSVTAAILWLVSAWLFFIGEQLWALLPNNQ